MNMTVDESVRGEGTFARLVDVSNALKLRVAGAVILGCAGMARHRAALEAKIGIPVIEPTQAAVTMALGTLLAG